VYVTTNADIQLTIVAIDIATGRVWGGKSSLTMSQVTGPIPMENEITLAHQHDDHQPSFFEVPLREEVKEDSNNCQREQHSS